MKKRRYKWFPSFVLASAGDWSRFDAGAAGVSLSVALLWTRASCIENQDISEDLILMILNSGADCASVVNQCIEINCFILPTYCLKYSVNQFHITPK